MKQFTNKEQTHHLIELGFEKPQPSFYQNGASWIMCDGNYSIGELLGFLPKKFNNHDLMILYQCGTMVHYKDTMLRWTNDELVYALYAACVELKNKGVI